VKKSSGFACSMIFQKISTVTIFKY